MGGLDRSTREALASEALEAAMRAGARFAEARLVRRTRESLEFKNGRLELSSLQMDAGIGVRALVGDGWGYGATNLLDRDSLRDAGARAVAMARATAASAQQPVEVPPAASGEYATPLDEDPFAVSVAEKAALFAEAHGRLLAEPGVKAARGTYTGHRQETTFLASNGSRQHQSVTLCGGGIAAIAQANGDVQQRSAPKSFEGNVLQGGYERLRAMDLAGLAPEVAREAVALTAAAPTPGGPTTIILDGAQLSLQIHESVGHPIELDRVLGEEISLAGASFLLPENLDRLTYGSELVSLTADATTPLGPGTFGYDDEGTPATATPIVERGRFRGYLSGRDTAARLGRSSASALRAESWSKLPIVRMVNVNLEPGRGSLDDLIGGVDKGLLLSVNKSWSIDDLRLNFQFSCEIAHEIRAGRLTGRIFKNPIYADVTPRFWQSCSGIAGPEEWRMWGWTFCGKGDPGQIMYVGHGCAPARFEGVQVGSS
ncbi:MAG: TldD/PmbA family protein [Deltaproteobacteria bacterium]|nr:TldD/PmbA family protein [Deltaproteobacteria bacterium]MCB9788419.1 TldD/PmbA family protein [Deltaproteobacteria bacterium]